MPDWNPICAIGPNNPTPSGCAPPPSPGGQEVGQGVPGSGNAPDLHNSPDPSAGFNTQDTVTLSAETSGAG